MARGDQIYVYRPFLNFQGVYEHHGIDCGDNSVIHYRKPSETIERTSLATFTWGNKIYLRPYQTCYIPDVVVHRAQSRLGENKYNLLFNNCEHFATWCKIGNSYSQQVKNFVPIISQMNAERLYEPIKQALEDAKRDDTFEMLNKALADIKVVWDQVQPQYNQALHEVNVWQRVAMEAVKQNRDDLARQAIQRKLGYQKQATELEEKLKQLANMTETLIRNRLNFPPIS